MTDDPREKKKKESEREARKVQQCRGFFSFLVLSPDAKRKKKLLSPIDMQPNQGAERGKKKHTEALFSQSQTANNHLFHVPRRRFVAIANPLDDPHPSINESFRSPYLKGTNVAFCIHGMPLLHFSPAVLHLLSWFLL